MLNINSPLNAIVHDDLLYEYIGFEEIKSIEILDFTGGYIAVLSFFSDTVFV